MGRGLLKSAVLTAFIVVWLIMGTYDGSSGTAYGEVSKKSAVEFGTVDRIEGKYVILETKKGMEDLPVSWFRVKPSDGDVVRIDRQRKSAVVDKVRTKKARDAALERLNNIFE